MASIARKQRLPRSSDASRIRSPSRTPCQWTLFHPLPSLPDNVSSRMDTGRIHPQRVLVEKSRSVVPYFYTCILLTRRLSIGILILNICLILPLLSASINGLDSSLVNGKIVEVKPASSCVLSLAAGLQILPAWQ